MIADDLSVEQAEAERQIDEFLDASRMRKPYFTLMGLAGTGKSFLLARIARQRKNAIMCAYTGKAASNLARKTGLRTSTVHSAIYRLLGKEVDEYGEEDLVFERTVRDDRWKGRIVLLDECGVCPTDMARDLIATGARIVAAGDPGQLRPVKGTQFFSEDAADFTLEEIRRQALDSPIIRQAHSVRLGRGYAADGDAFRVQRFVEREDILVADMILCWRNATRRAVNALKRAHLGLSGPPMPGEPVMCLRNDHDLGIMNGATYDLKAIETGRYPGVAITIVNERGAEATIEGAWFEDVDETTRKLDDAIGFTFGWSATVHKAQGSEFPKIILIDEYSRADDRERWLYTAISRAQESIIVQRSW